MRRYHGPPSPFLSHEEECERAENRIVAKFKRYPGYLNLLNALQACNNETTVDWLRFYLAMRHPRHCPMSHSVIDRMLTDLVNWDCVEHVFTAAYVGDDVYRFIKSSPIQREQRSLSELLARPENYE